MNRPNDAGASRLLTREAFRQRLEERGETVTDWAREHGFSREQVYAFLAGRTKGKRGISHRLAIAVGVKAGPVDESEPQSECSEQASGTRQPVPQTDRPSFSLGHRCQEPRGFADNTDAAMAAISTAQEIPRTER